ncbi:hypothetical protein [Massilia sp. TWR1-2-2]|uniref:hypothetical protein n=1 Tax=Massilia sp. TWR1-2-2 TaxID=2804584 RepID=UPI003CEF7128
MEDRLAVLEKDVISIKSELAVPRQERTSAAEINARTTRIEIELAVVKGDIAQLRREISQLREDLFDLQKRVMHLEVDVAELRRDVCQLREDVTQLGEDISELRTYVRAEFASVRDERAGIRVEVTRLATEQAHFATKDDLKTVESSLRGWMLGIALTLITLNFAMVYPLYSALKTSPLAAPPHVQQAPAPIGRQPAASVR